MEIDMAQAVMHAFFNALGHIWWVLPLVILASVFKTPWFKGVSGEWLVRFLLGRGPLAGATQYHDVILPHPKGTSQIDHVCLSTSGVFVIETKNYKGLIFGKRHDRTWTQVLGKRKNRFQNPLVQNAGHIRTLVGVTGLPESAFHSVVVFVGSAKLKKAVPANVVRIGKMNRYIASLTDGILSNDDLRLAVERIDSEKFEATRDNRRLHKQRVARKK